LIASFVYPPTYPLEVISVERRKSSKNLSRDLQLVEVVYRSDAAHAVRAGGIDTDCPAGASFGAHKVRIYFGAALSRHGPDMAMTWATEL